MMTALSTAARRSAAGFGWGTLIGSLGGLIGLGGAEFRLPVLVGRFKLPTLEAVILNKAMSLVVVAFALIFRGAAIPFHQLGQHVDIAANLLAGSLIGAWWAAGHAVRLPRNTLDRVILVLLVLLAVVILSEAWLGRHEGGAPLVVDPLVRWGAGVVAGLFIGMVAALLGVAGGELLIPTLVLLYGLDIKLAGSLSLMISLPTMLVGFVRYRQSDAFTVLARERQLLLWMAAGSIAGAAVGGLLLGSVASAWLMTGLGLILFVSAIKIFQHGRKPA